MKEMLSGLTAGVRNGVLRLLVINFILFFVSLPVISWFYLVINTYANAGLDQDMIDILPGIGYFASVLLQLPPVVFYGLFLLSVLCVGSFILGFHAVGAVLLQGRTVTFSDFFRQARQNAFPGVLLGLFGVVLVHVSLWNIFGGMGIAEGWVSGVFLASRWVSLLILILFFLSTPFLCQITVTCELSVWAAVKNSMILARVYLGRCLLILLAILIYWWVTSVMFPLVGLFALPFFSLALTVMGQVVICFPLVEKHVWRPDRGEV